MNAFGVDVAVGDKVLVKQHTENFIRIVDVIATPKDTYFIARFPAGYNEGFFYAGETDFIGKIDGDEIIMRNGVRNVLKEVIEYYTEKYKRKEPQ